MAPRTGGGSPWAGARQAGSPCLKTCSSPRAGLRSGGGSACARRAMCWKRVVPDRDRQEGLAAMTAGRAEAAPLCILLEDIASTARDFCKAEVTPVLLLP